MENEKNTRARLTDLPKAFDTVNYEILIIKLNAFGFGKDTLKFIL